MHREVLRRVAHGVTGAAGFVWGLGIGWLTAFIFWAIVFVGSGGDE